MSLIIHILNGLICMVLGVHLGIHLLATDLSFQKRMNYNEFKHVTSWNFTWYLLSGKKDIK